MSQYVSNGITRDFIMMRWGMFNDGWHKENGHKVNGIESKAAANVECGP